MSQDHIFDKLKDSLLKLDPVTWSEKNLTLDGKPFRLVDSGYKPLVEIFRYIGVKALDRDAKPVVWVKARQVAGTTTASALEMYFMGSGLFGNSTNPPMRICHNWPTLDRAAAYSKTKLASMIDSSVMVDNGNGKKGQKPLMKSLIDSSAASNDNVQFKQFAGGNHLWIESVGIDGSRLRGKTADLMFMDEVQEMPSTAISNSTKVLTKAQYGMLGEGVQVYFGTPLQRGSGFWNLWQQSSQQYYHLGCDKCKELFPLYTPGSNEWESIWIHGNVVKCTKCGYEQDRMEAINRGKWVATRDPADAKFVGFHLNQLYLPEFTKEKIMDAKPGNSAINTERAYQNEVLGEFFQGDAAIITPEEIREKCGDPERRFRANIAPGEETITFLGIDIGAKADLEQLVNSDKIAAQGQSYSTAVILSVSGAGRLSIEFAAKFKRNDLASKKSFVDEVIKKYSCNLAVCDIGYAHDFNQIMQTEYGDKFLASQVSARVNEKVKYNQDVFPKVITFEKDHWIMELYEQMKKGMVRFPLGSYEQVAWLMQHCSNMEIKPSISRTGDVSPHYVKSGPNDGFMALLNAYIAYKFYLTKGFQIKNPLLHDDLHTKKKQQASVIAVYSPR
jgi:hypothetical protein